VCEALEAIKTRVKVSGVVWFVNIVTDHIVNHASLLLRCLFA